jgi:type IV pilus assembly protein PilE
MLRSHRSRIVRADVHGFTLIELMIALVVLAILATIAYPTYTEFVMRSRIIDATSQLNDFRTRMEQFFQDNRTYDGGGACGIAPQMPVYDATQDNFAFVCALNPGATMPGYTITATGNASKGLSGFTYALTVAPNTGALTRSTPGVHPGWSLPSPNTCWAVRKSGKCS